MDEVVVSLLGIVTTVVGLFGWLLKRVMDENSKREDAYRQTVAENQRVILAQQTAISALADRYEELKGMLLDISRRLDRKEEHFGGAGVSHLRATPTR